MFKIILIIIGLIIPTYNTNQTTPIKDVNNLVVRSENNNLYLKTSTAHLVVDSQTVESLENDTYYTIATFNTGETLQGRYTNTDSAFRLYIQSANNERVGLAVYSTASSDLEYVGANINYNVLTYRNTNNIVNSGLSLTYETFFDTVYDNALNKPTVFYKVGYDNENYDLGYDDGYERGFKDGQNDVLTSPSNFNIYTEEQYFEYGNERYAEGVAYNSDFTMFGLITAIFTAPVVFFKEAFNFEFFGLNISNLILFLLSVSIVIFVIGIFKKK